MTITHEEIKTAVFNKVSRQIDAATINHHVRRGTMSRESAVEKVAHNFSVDFQREMEWPELYVDEAIQLARFIDQCAADAVDAAMAREEAAN